MLGVFTLLTLVDFSRIRAGGGGATPVELAVAIYLDAINIFLALLELFGSRGRRTTAAQSAPETGTRLGRVR